MAGETPRSLRFQRKIALLAGAGMFIDGFDVAVIAVALPGLRQEWNITSGLVSGVVASAVVLGMFFGMMFGGRLVDKFGRRKMYLFDLLGFVVFALAAALTQNVWQLIAARFMLGLFIGADYPISSSVTAEFTSPKRRGGYIIFMSLLWQLGAFTAYVTGIVLMQVGDSAWRWMLAVGALLAVIVIIMRHSMPESPRWLRAQGRDAEADAIERQVFEEHDLVINSGSGVKPASASKGQWRELFSPLMIRATVFCSVFWFAFAVSFYGIQMYTPTILGPFTEGRPELAFLGAALIAALGVVGAGIGMFTVERWGRRRQMIWCFVGMVIALVVLALWQDPTLTFLIVFLSITILLANLGPGVLNMVYPNEMFPTRLRGTGVGFAGSVSRIGSILGVLVFPVLVDSWGMANATWLFAGVAIIGLATAVALAPETKGRSMEELEELANNGWRDESGERVVYGNFRKGA
ncbi:MFS transporter, putative metabolite transport protein [Tessaracoccus bendigoensis DSM 12906]|uniref:MFS transporter, putative metabolite transport protein n=2 Tax=Tessaracoccus TaxID=72763 RepID=A0A1M6HPY9_9ACTN|nr:MFS transporter, putative metabolite transport protein [Tessaracoccus bendigoensis DSM 12906]